MNEKPQTARSYRGNLVDDNAIISINLKWLAQGAILVGSLVYSYWRIETRIINLEESLAEADTQIEELVSKHIEDEEQRYKTMQEQVSFYEKEFNINPLSWGKRKVK
tara:strand:+ start:2175 stop:2495 length:321 start_codon:yes stop_codon:yes gene_type:complete